MANTTTASKTGITRNAFKAYRATHGRVPLHTLRKAYSYRRSVVCEALGISLAEFNARARAAVEALVGFPGKYADRVQAYSYVANRLEAMVEVAEAVAPAAPVDLVSLPANDNAVPASGVDARWAITLIDRYEGGGMYSAGVRGTYEEACAAASGMARAAVGWRVIGPSPTCPEALRLAAIGMQVRAAVN